MKLGRSCPKQGASIAGSIKEIHLHGVVRKPYVSSENSAKSMLEVPG
jgi:hypothetical protein